MKGKIIDIQKHDALVVLEDKQIKYKNIVQFNTKTGVGVLAQNNADAKVGDSVELEMQKNEFNALAWSLFLLPLVLLVAGFLIGMALKNELYLFVIGAAMFVVGVIISFVLSKILNKRHSELLVVTKVLKRGK